MNQLTMVFRLGHLDIRNFAFMAKMRECEIAKEKVRRSKVEGAKVQKCDCEARRCEGECATLRRSDTAIAHSPQQLRTLAFAFAFFHCIQQVSVDYQYIEFDTGTILAQGLPIKLRYYWYACAGPSCLLRMYINILMCTFTKYVYQCWLCLIIIFSTYNVMSAIL